MATTNRREVELALQVTTANAESIVALRNDVAKLAKEGGDAAPEFQKLTEELDQLAAQAKSLQVLDTLAGNVQQLTAAQQAAADRSRELTTEFSALRAATDAAAQAQDTAKQKLTEARNSVQAQADALRLLRAEHAAGKTTELEYTNAVAAGTVALNEARARVRDLRTEYDAAEKTTKAARQAQNDLSNEFRNAATAADAANRRLVEGRAAADAAAQAMGATSLATSDLAGAQLRVQQALGATKNEVQELINAQVRAEAAAARLADEQAAATIRAQGDAADYANFWVDALNKRDAAAAESAAKEKAAADAMEAEWKAALASVDDARRKSEALAKEAADREKQNAAEVAAARVAAEQKAVAAMQQTIQEAKAAGDAVKNAFATVGVQSVEALEDKITATRSAMNLLKSSGALVGPELAQATKQGERAIADLERQIRAAKGELTLMDKATGLWRQSLGGVSVGSAVTVAAIAKITQAVVDSGRAMVEAITKNERFAQSLNNIYSNAGTTADQIAFLRKSANDAGVAVGDIQQGFIKFSAAMNGANVPLSQSNALFSALTKAGGSLGLSTDAVNRAMEALGQMASKGTVSMEELRQQLGDALPGALGIAARGLGLTETEVIKLVSSGQLAAKDFFPAFTQGLASVAGEADTLSQNFERLKNGINAMFIAIGDAGVLDILKGGLFAVTEAAKGLGVALITMVEGFSTTIRMAAAASAALFNGGGLSGALDAVTSVASAANDRIAKLTGELYGTSEAANTATVSATANADAMGTMDEATAGASKALLALNLAVADKTERLKHDTTIAELNAKTSDALADAQVKVAKSTGDVNLLVDAQIDAYGRKVESAQAVLDSEIEMLRLMQEQYSATALLLQADGELDASDLKRLETMGEQITKQAAVVEGLRTGLAVRGEELAQAELTKQMLQDNSARLGELQLAYDNATRAVEAMRVAQGEGGDVATKLTAALQAQATAAQLLGDAKRDLTEKLRAHNIEAKAEADLEQAEYALKLKKYDVLIQLAQAAGNTNAVRDLTIAKLKVEIEMTEAKAKAMVVEADGIIAVAKAEMARLEALGQLTPVQKASLQASIDNANAKKLEAAALVEGNKVLSQQIDLLGRGANGLNTHASASNTAANAQDRLANSAMNATAALEAQNAQLERQNAAKEKAVELENKRRNVDKEGFGLNTAGERAVGGGMNKSTALAAAKSAGLSEKEALRIVESSFTGDRRVMFGVNAFDIPGIVDPFKFNDALDKALVREATKRVGDSQQPVGSSPTEQSARATTNSQLTAAKTYNVNINGTTVRTASDADAQKLLAALKNAKLSA